MLRAVARTNSIRKVRIILGGRTSKAAFVSDPVGPWSNSSQNISSWKLPRQLGQTGTWSVMLGPQEAAHRLDQKNIRWASGVDFPEPKNLFFLILQMKGTSHSLCRNKCWRLPITFIPIFRTSGATLLATCIWIHVDDVHVDGGGTMIVPVDSSSVHRSTIVSIL